MSVYKDSEGLKNNISPIYIVIKIISWDMDTTLNKKEIFNKTTNYRNIHIFLLVLHLEFTFWDYLDITQDMIFQNYKSAMEILGIYQKREITISKTVDVPLNIVWPLLFQLLKVIRDIIMTLKWLYKAKISYYNISINNIICTLKKGEYIVLKNGASITAKSSTLLAD